MRKLLTILFLIFSFFGAAQTFPNNQWFGSATTLTEMRGAMKGGVGIILTRYSDTATANLNPYIKNYAGAEIVVGDTIWFRNSTASQWLKASGGSGSGGGNTLYTADDDLISNRIVGLNGKTLNINQGANVFLYIDPAVNGEVIELNARNITGGGNFAGITGQTTGSNSQFDLKASFDAGASVALITASAGGGLSELNIQADSISINGVIQFNHFAGFGSGIVAVDNNGLLSFSPPMGNTIYTGDGELFDDREIDLNGKVLSIMEGANSFLTINPTSGNELSRIRAYNITGGDNFADLKAGTSNTDASVTIEANFNSDAKRALISAFADATVSTLAYTANTHTFVGDIEYNGDAKLLANRATDLNGKILRIRESGNDFLSINPTVGSEEARLRAYNVTGGDNESNFRAITTNTNAQLIFNASFDGSTKEVVIEGIADATTASIEYTADTHNFTGNILPATDDGVQLGSTTKSFSDLFLATGAVINYANSNVVLTHSSGILTMGTGEMRITTVGTNAASVVTVAGSQALTNKSINKVTITAPTTSATLTLVNGSSLITVGAFAATLTSTATTNATLPAGTNTLYSTLSGSITSAQLATSLSNETGTGVSVFGTSPTFTTSILLAGATSGNITLASDALSNALNGTTLSGLGVIDSRMFARPTSDFTLANSNADQTAFGASHDVWTLQASTSYWVEGFYFLTHGAVSHAVSIGFTLGGSASITSMNLDVGTYIAAVNVVATAQSSMYLTQTASTAVNLAGANGTEMISFRGWINVNVGGTFTPILKFSADPTGTCLMKAGSYITFTPRGTNTVESAGNVN